MQLSQAKNIIDGQEGEEKKRPLMKDYKTGNIGIGHYTQIS